MGLVLVGMDVGDTARVGIMNVGELKRLIFIVAMSLLGKLGSGGAFLRSGLVQQAILLISREPLVLTVSDSGDAGVPAHSLQVHSSGERALKLVEILGVDVPRLGNELFHLGPNVTLYLQLLNVLEVLAHGVLFEEVSDKYVLDVALFLGKARRLTLCIGVRVARTAGEVPFFPNWFAQRKYLLNVH